MPIIILPDVVSALVAWLKAVPEVAALVGDRIGTHLTGTNEWPAVRIDPIGGDPILEFRIDQPNLQIHYFATSDVAAMNGARTVRAAVSAMAGFRVPGQIVVIDVTTSSPQLLPDEDRTPTIAHATFSASVAVRPDP